jgi:hypothetical protein
LRMSRDAGIMDVVQGPMHLGPLMRIRLMRPFATAAALLANKHSKLRKKGAPTMRKDTHIAARRPPAQGKAAGAITGPAPPLPAPAVARSPAQFAKRATSGTRHHCD